MAKQNLAFLLGSVAKEVRVVKDREGRNLYAMAYINVARGLREVGDHRKYMKCDNPIIMTRDENMMAEIATWHHRDIVFVKGVIASKHIKKASYCEYCNTKNSFPGALVYVNPIYVKKQAHFNTDEECLQYLADNREISNQIFVFGTLCRDPKKITPREGLTVTQYQIAMNRKFRIQTDPPEIKTDYPWVKSYGENAKEDRNRLRVGSVVYIDGCLQARSVQRHAFCGQACDEKGKVLFYEGGEPVMILENVDEAVASKTCKGKIMIASEYARMVQAKDEFGNLMYHENREPVMRQKTEDVVARGQKTQFLVFEKNGLPVNAGCGEQYIWKDRAMEIVPYATEYLYNYRDDDEVEAFVEERKAQIERDRAANGKASDDDVIDSVEDDGIDTMQDEQ